MKLLRILSFCLFACTARAIEIDELFDRLDQALTFGALTFGAFHENVRARLSGTVDLELYHFEQPAPGLIDSDIDTLFNPRLTLFLDTQIGSHVYVFVQSRVDRGFDPSDHGAQVRADEYALRVTPWDDSRFTLQIGKFATVVGNWVARHLSWDNPFINAPLPYENVTAISDKSAPASARDFVNRFEREKYEFVPVIWGPSYASGISVSGRLGRFDYAAEMKNASLSSRPESWSVAAMGFEQPTFSARVGFEFVIGQDISYAVRHLQLWAEFYEARFEVPRAGDADTFAYYFEAKYKFAPQWFGALRWNQQFFSNIDNRAGRGLQWGPDLARIELAAGYRFTSHTQIKVQYSYQHETSGTEEDNHLIATQFTVRF